MWKADYDKSVYAHVHYTVSVVLMVEAAFKLITVDVSLEIYFTTRNKYV